MIINDTIFGELEFDYIWSRDIAVGFLGISRIVRELLIMEWFILFILRGYKMDYILDIIVLKKDAGTKPNVFY